VFVRDRPPRWLLLVLAIALSAVTALASALWMIAIRPQGPDATVELGFSNTYDEIARAERVDAVSPDSPATRAGLRAGDRIRAVDGEPLADASAIVQAWSRYHPGDVVTLTVVRAGEVAPIELRATFRYKAPAVPANYVARQVHDLFPVPFVIVGLAVLFLRVEDRNVWLLALLFACMVQTPGVPNGYQMFDPRLRAFALADSSISIGLVGPIFYFFFAVFPERSPLDRRWPWLKWAAIVAGLALALPGVESGGLRLLPSVARLAGEAVSSQVPIVFVIVCFALGLAALTANFASTRDVGARRKIRVIFWGTVVGVVPGLANLALTNFTSFRMPAAIAMLVPAVALVLPVSFAYAVVRHRVLEIPVLIRRSARYLLVQRGFMLLVSTLSIGLAVLFASWFTRVVPTLDRTSAVLLGAVFGTALLWGGLNIHRRVSERIDRAFFRTAYDARVILEDLAERLRAVDHRSDVAVLLERHLRDALQPTRLVVHLDDGTGTLRTDSTDLEPALRSIDRESQVLALVAGYAVPFDLTASDGELVRDAVAPLVMPGAECLVPMTGRGGGLVGLIALGPRRSEEPYAGEDLRLLGSVAAQAATALENIRLAEEIARRMETERRAAHEMDIARQVQARLLPEAPPPLATLDCAARCVQARDVGGDGYDFIDLGPGRVGFVLADVSGKGIHAALLMATLQAHLRSQSGIAPLDPFRVLSEVNRLLFGSTATEHYATVFLGVYDDGTRRLRYVNGGLNPPVLLPGRADAAPVRLAPTAPAVGLFEAWKGTADEIAMEPGDVLALFSDGVTEAMHGEDEFGEARFIEELAACRGRSASETVETILASVQAFSAGTQYDDLTLVVARAR
jgi:sigma-B regulation protein RsbU (phosphoserine phosphatase)